MCSLKSKDYLLVIFDLQCLGQGQCVIKSEGLTGAEAAHGEDPSVHWRQGSQAGVGKINPGGFLLFLALSLRY